MIRPEGFLDAVNTPPPKPKGKLEQLRHELSGTAEAAARFEELLRDTSYPVQRLADNLTASGFPIGRSAVQVWRNNTLKAEA